MINHIQYNMNKTNGHFPWRDVSVNHFYVSSTTLIKLNKGMLTLNVNNNDVLECSGESLILIEKNQTLSINFREVDDHLDFKLINISSDLMSKMYSLVITGNEQPARIQKSSSILSSPLRPGMGEAFDYVFNHFQNAECDEYSHRQMKEESAQLDFILMFLLSAFTFMEDGVGILTRTVKSTLREKIHNMIKNEPSKNWSLDNVAENLFMSRSTLKRKLALEETSFNEIYLDVRMYIAARLLRTGDYNIAQVATMCQYSHSSYFITTFKKYFQMTPYAFMKLVNH